MDQINRRDEGLLYLTDDTLVEHINNARRILQKLNSMDRDDIDGINSLAKELMVCKGDLLLNPPFCCFTYKPVFGNLHDNSFAEIWRSDRAEQLREIAKSGEYIDSPCIGCDTGHPVFTKDLELTGSLDSFFEMSINAR